MLCVSEWSTRPYELTIRLALRALVTEEMAKAITKLNPMRQQRYLLSDQNPLLATVENPAEKNAQKPEGR